MKPLKHLSGPSRFGSSPVRESSKAYLDELGINTLFYPFLLHRLKQLFGPVGDKSVFITFLLKPSKHLSGPSRFGSPPVRDPSKAYLDELGINSLFYPSLLHRPKQLSGPVGNEMVSITFLLKPSIHLFGPSRFGSPLVRDSSKAYLDELGVSTIFYPCLLHRLQKLFGPIGEKMVFITFLPRASKHLSGPSRF